MESRRPGTESSALDRTDSESVSGQHSDSRHSIMPTIVAIAEKLERHLPRCAIRHITVSLSARCCMGMTGRISRFLAVAGVVLGLAPALAQAQGTAISGQVTGTGGAPVVGASVSIPTLRAGGFTDETGHYSFTAPASANGTTVTLLARRLGFQPSSASVSLTGAPLTQSFSLSTAATQLQGVVVTALGLTREKSQLGTAQQQLSNTEINQTPRADRLAS
ncbi:MAG: hypothetical protein DMD39_08700 [Gemmatimonadetes bacterium]|nr:MAG: hypothetical protein DMD39_08700 [Gemmatimonadota bacterium]